MVQHSVTIKYMFSLLSRFHQMYSSMQIVAFFVPLFTPSHILSFLLSLNFSFSSLLFLYHFSFLLISSHLLPFYLITSSFVWQLRTEFQFMDKGNQGSVKFKQMQHVLEQPQVRIMDLRLHPNPWNTSFSKSKYLIWWKELHLPASIVYTNIGSNNSLITTAIISTKWTKKLHKWVLKVLPYLLRFWVRLF